jgi:hypothetical protein
MNAENLLTVLAILLLLVLMLKSKFTILILDLSMTADNVLLNDVSSVLQRHV